MAGRKVKMLSVQLDKVAVTDKGINLTFKDGRLKESLDELQKLIKQEVSLVIESTQEELPITSGNYNAPPVDGQLTIG